MTLDNLDKDILRILIRKRRRMSATEISTILKKEGTKISRPTISKRLMKLKKSGWVVGSFMANPMRFPRSNALTPYQKEILRTLARANTWMTANAVSERTNVEWITAKNNLVILGRKGWVLRKDQEWHINLRKLKNLN